MAEQTGKLCDPKVAPTMDPLTSSSFATTIISSSSSSSVAVNSPPINVTPNDKMDVVADLMQTTLNTDEEERIFEVGELEKIKEHAIADFVQFFEQLCPPGRPRKDSPTSGPVTDGSLPAKTKPSILTSLTPPNWDEQMHEVLAEPDPNSNFKRFKVSRLSNEYKILKNLMKPLTINTIYRIVNPTVWDAYETRRMEMLKAHSEDVNVLTALGMTEEKAILQVESCKKVPNSSLFLSEQGKYALNEALLYHGTRTLENVEKILDTGLDSRLARIQTGNLLGSGSYFADNPNKSLGYTDKTNTMLLCLVLLGDCKYVGFGGQGVSNLRIEPEKQRNLERRNVGDIRFDSITAHPGAGNMNEYVIFKYNQCYPLYEVKFIDESRILQPTRRPWSSSSSSASAISNVPKELKAARESPPNIAWIPQTTTLENPTKFHLPNPTKAPAWPFLAYSLFKKMGANVPQLDMTGALKVLHDFGYRDKDDNIKALIESDNNVEEAAAYLQKLRDQKMSSEGLLNADEEDFANDDNKDDSTTDFEEEEQPPAAKKSKTTNIIIPMPSTFSSSTTTTTNTSKTSNASKTSHEKCPICLEVEDFYVTLKCNHEICENCFPRIKFDRITMHGIRHKFKKCPECNDVEGIEIGTCPDGYYERGYSPYPCEGYEGVGSIVITFDFRSQNLRGKRVRTVYFPDNNEGREVADLLKVAWDRRLCFDVDTSFTTGEPESLVWLLHFKTSQTGGVMLHGYPDPTYLDRFKNELAGFGVM